ncbi:hypothetical protein HK096_002006, partial [Nowakowskiella sp. JEL0078]
MGVPGLSSTINGTNLGRKDEKVQIVIVDGNGFLHHVLKVDVDCRFGGAYVDIEKAIIARTATLHLNGISPIFVFDGPLPTWKWNHRVLRETQKIARLYSFVETLLLHSQTQIGSRTQKFQNFTDLNFQNGFVSEASGFLSPMALNCCVHSLLQLNVPVLLADGEADTAIAQLARKLDASVM